jgi:4-aminobutyrate aminotransferase-like enzyme
MGWETGAKYANHVREMVAQVQGNSNGVAAFIAESVLGCGGQIVLPDGYLAEAYKHVRAAGGICIADEVQVGFGRVGTHFWGFETQGVVPDIVTMGKPIGNGHPLGAVVTTPEIADAFANGMEYFNTFGGNPVSCAVGLAVLDVIEQEGLQAHALRVGNRLMTGLRHLMPRYPLIGDVRGLGLFVGIELVLDRERKLPAGDHASYVANRMRDHGILISTDGPDHNVLKLKPPIVFDEQDADRLVATLDKVLAEDAVQL